jgi:hypothetical protein
MELVCIQDFGLTRVGDVVEVPDDSEYSAMYFAENPKGKGSRSSKRPAQLANATDKAQGENVDEASTPIVNPEPDNESYGAADSESPSDEEKSEG